MYSQFIGIENKNVIRKHWNSTAVFTGAWRLSSKKQELKETELLPGELSAVVCKVGCYIVRSAQRVYKIHELGYEPSLENPASKEEIELVREYVRRVKAAGGLAGYLAIAIAGMPLPCLSLGGGLRIALEISARHHADPTPQYTFVCKATQAGNANWIESIKCICTAKKHTRISNECASLFVLSHYEGNSFGADTWYKLDPTGKITTLSLHPFDPNMDDARFE